MNSRRADPGRATDTWCSLATASSPGAVAIVQVGGSGAIRMLGALTGVTDWPVGRVRLVDIGGIDRGMACVLRSGDVSLVQFMPHGGPRIVGQLLERLVKLGCAVVGPGDACHVYPEADSEIEADMLAAIARAASPAAVDRLLAQPAVWRMLVRGGPISTSTADAILSRSRVLDRLVDAPTVVVVGRPNVGKSTLANFMMGRSASVVADLPGTTRDWVGGMVELCPPGALIDDAIAVRWIDTPGLRDSRDAVERSAITLAAPVVAAADVLIAMKSPEIEWPDAAALPRNPDLWVVNKCDTIVSGPSAGAAPDGAATLAISATAGQGVAALGDQIVERLGLAGPDRADHRRTPADEPWAFTDVLRNALRARDWTALAATVASCPPSDDIAPRATRRD